MNARAILEEIMGNGHGGTPPSGPGGLPDMSQYPKRSLGEILEVLPEMIQDQIMQIFNSGMDERAMVNELKSIFSRFQAELDTVEVNGDYLAYMLVYYVLPQLRSQQGL